MYTWTNLLVHQNIKINVKNHPNQAVFPWLGPLEVGACCGAPPRCRYPYLSGDFLHRAGEGHMRVVVWVLSFVQLVKVSQFRPLSGNNERLLVNRLKSLILNGNFRELSGFFQKRTGNLSPSKRESRWP